MLGPARDAYLEVLACRKDMTLAVSRLADGTDGGNFNDTMWVMLNYGTTEDPDYNWHAVVGGHEYQSLQKSIKGEAQKKGLGIRPRDLDEYKDIARGWNTSVVWGRVFPNVPQPTLPEWVRTPADVYR